MDTKSSRRALLKLAGVSGVVFASGLRGARADQGDFWFVQLSDTHWGYQGPANPEAQVELPRAVQLVNALPQAPDFVVFTGDLTHTTDDGQERRRRLSEFRRHAARLQVPAVRLLAGEHDAALDAGAAFAELCGALHYSFDHKGIHFAVLDNVSDPRGMLGPAQIDWLSKDLAPLRKDAPVVVFTHRPLFDLKADWDWTTADGAKAIDVLLAYRNVTVFYGHIHQEHHHATDHIQHHAARSLIFPLPAPGSVPKKAPLPWDPAHPRRGLGLRRVRAPAERIEEIAL